ncbi:MAG: hypothetical protein HQK54_09410 [Oligoflexales bacterium]|nr:hypothetical protein [Oligoflexales bacterium]
MPRKTFVLITALVCTIHFKSCAEDQKIERITKDTSSDSMDAGPWKIKKDVSESKNPEIIDARISKSGGEARLWFTAKEDLDLLVFCDSPPLTGCVKGSGKFYTTRDWVFEAGQRVFKPSLSYDITDLEGERKIVAVGVRNGSVKAQVYFSISTN